MDALITEAKNGDKEAFVRLIRMNKQSLYTETERTEVF